jgi:SAM-dependent methyltransferase
MKNTKTNEKLFWDSRARNYPLPFDRETAAKTRRILRLLARLGADFRGKRVLDIGCGTGVYALQLAGEAASTCGIDSSSAMLAVFRRERARRGIKNASCVKADWAKLPAGRVKGKYDIALASMTMAVRNKAGLRKMEGAARELCVYIGWAGIRRNSLLERVYAAHGLEYRAPQGAARVLELLGELGREPETRYLKDSWTKEASVRETLRDLEVNMRVNGTALRKAWTQALLRRRARGGKVRQLTRVRKAVIVWRPPGARRPAGE